VPQGVSNPLGRVVRIVDTTTGEIHEIDQGLARLKRMRRRLRAWGEQAEGLQLDYIMVTLTYRPGESWQPKHISSFLRHWRSDTRLGQHVQGYAWVMELQQRGAPHYHVLLAVSRGFRIPKPDKAGLWPHGSTQVQKARSPLRYLAKYAQKLRQKAGALGFPPGARLFAVRWRDKGLAHILRGSALPAWLRRLVGPGVPAVWPSRLRGGGWLWGGQVVRSPFMFWGLGP